MANAIYPKAKTHFLKADVDADTATWKAYLVDLADYTYNASHETLSDLPVAARVASAALTSVTAGTVSAGTLDCADFTFSLVSGDPCEALVITAHNGTTEYLVAYYDTGVTGLPVTPNGGDINVTVSASGLFTL